jgi:hypothetical protein
MDISMLNIVIWIWKLTFQFWKLIFTLKKLIWSKNWYLNSKLLFSNPKISISIQTHLLNLNIDIDFKYFYDNFKTYPILFVFHSYFEHYINNVVWSFNFTLRNLCTWDEQIKRFNPKQKIKNYAHFLSIYLPNLLIYLGR